MNEKVKLHSQMIYKLLADDDMYYLKACNILHEFHEYLEDNCIKGIINNKQFDMLFDKAFDIAKIY